MQEVEHVAQEGRGVIFSGSPRTMGEAEVEIPTLIEVYGKEGVRIFSTSDQRRATGPIITILLVMIPSRFLR